MIRALHRVPLAWHRWHLNSRRFGLYALRRHAQSLIAQIETGIKVVPYRHEALQAERRNLVGINLAIRAHERAATQAAMAARI